MSHCNTEHTSKPLDPSKSQIPANRKATAPEIFSSPIPHAPTAELYIDEENQSATILEALSCALQQLNLPVTRIYIAGRQGNVNHEGWRIGLKAYFPHAMLHLDTTPALKESADASLVMRLGLNIPAHRELNQTIVVVSKDQYLTRAAEHAQRWGCKSYVVYAAGGFPAVKSERVTTLVLPVSAAATGIVAALPVDLSEFTSLLNQTCAPHPLGGFLLKHVNKVLQRLGFYDYKTRCAIVNHLPGWRIGGFAPELRLIPT